MYVSKQEVRNAQEVFLATITSLPPEMYEVLGSFHQFIQDVPNYFFIQDVPNYFYNFQKYEMNETAARRIALLNGDNVEMLLRIHAIRLLADKQAEQVRQHHKRWNKQNAEKRRGRFK